MLHLYNLIERRLKPLEDTTRALNEQVRLLRRDMHAKGADGPAGRRAAARGSVIGHFAGRQPGVSFLPPSVGALATRPSGCWPQLPQLLSAHCSKPDERSSGLPEGNAVASRPVGSRSSDNAGHAPSDEDTPLGLFAGLHPPASAATHGQRAEEERRCDEQRQRRLLQQHRSKPPQLLQQQREEQRQAQQQQQQQEEEEGRRQQTSQLVPVAAPASSDRGSDADRLVNSSEDADGMASASMQQAWGHAVAALGEIEQEALVDVEAELEAEAIEAKERQAAMRLRESLLARSNQEALFGRGGTSGNHVRRLGAERGAA